MAGFYRPRYETEPVTVTQARRQKETGAALEAYLHSLVDPYGEVTASQVASRLRGGCPDGDTDGGVPGGTRDAGPYLYSK